MNKPKRQTFSSVYSYNRNICDKHFPKYGSNTGLNLLINFHKFCVNWLLLIAFCYVCNILPKSMSKLIDNYNCHLVKQYSSHTQQMSVDKLYDQNLAQIILKIESDIYLTAFGFYKIKMSAEYIEAPVELRKPLRIDYKMFMNAGPTNVSPRVMDAINQPLIHFMDPKFLEVFIH